jgi:hypothetical protein
MTDQPTFTESELWDIAITPPSTMDREIAQAFKDAGIDVEDDEG